VGRVHKPDKTLYTCVMNI